MASTIQLKTGTGSAVPSSLTQGEVAINIDNGLVYYGSGSTNTTKQLESFTQITASGNISASGKFIGKIDTTDTNADDNFYAMKVQFPEYYEDSQKNIDDVLLKVCNSEQLIDIKPSNFELIIYKVANIGGEYKLEKIAC